VREWRQACEPWEGWRCKGSRRYRHAKCLVIAAQASSAFSIAATGGIGRLILALRDAEDGGNLLRMASSPAPETKREEALVALGRREAAQRQRAAEKVEENKELKKERNAYKAALRESEEERAKGSPMEKVIMGVSLGAGVAAGGAAQHY